MALEADLPEGVSKASRQSKIIADLVDLRSVDSKILATLTLAFINAFGAKLSLLTYFADLSGPALRY